jgi:MerR family transcriptional regulator, light-induced transcriptional regulator
MADQEGKYNIKAAAIILGIQPGTLRAWERRYQMIAPVRNNAGHRLYTEEHIKILKWLIKKVNQGFTISQAISLMDHNHAQMDLGHINLKQGNQLDSLTEDLYDSLIHFDKERTSEVINALFSIFSIEKVILDIFSQILMKIEDSYKKVKINNAQRHYSCSLIKTRIATIIDSFPNNANLNKAVCMTCTQEGDNVSLLMFSFYLRKHGIEVINLGIYSSEEDINETMELIHPDLFIISCEDQKDIKAALLLVKYLSLNHKELTIGLSGNAIPTMNPADKEHYSAFIIGQTMKEWEMWLMERMVF